MPSLFLLSGHAAVAAIYITSSAAMPLILRAAGMRWTSSRSAGAGQLSSSCCTPTYRHVMSHRARDNHYVPQFLLARWCDAHGKLTVYARRGGRIATSRLAPRGTAFEPNLYAYDDPIEERQYAIEINFMTPRIDTPAAAVCHKIVDGGLAGLTKEERSDFTRFVLSLRARHPDAIAMIRTEGSCNLAAELARHPGEYLAPGASRPPRTLLDLAEIVSPGLVKNFGMSVFTGVITDNKIGARLFNMPWWVYDTSEASADLLISDRPCILEGNAIEGACVIVLPLSPRMLFFICNDERRITFLTSLNPTQMVDIANRATIMSASDRVYGTGRHHLPMVDQYLRKRS
jgi:Protein of unknown function (DUF4238)